MSPFFALFLLFLKLRNVRVFPGYFGKEDTTEWMGDHKLPICSDFLTSRASQNAPSPGDR